jgi:hypothetical protein
LTTRRLISTRRQVAADRSGEYHAVWAKLRDEVTGNGVHAWRFVSAGYPSEYLEFLEFASGSDPRVRSPAAELLAELDRLGGGTSEEWDESPG